MLCRRCPYFAAQINEAMKGRCTVRKQQDVALFRNVAELPAAWDQLLPEGHDLSTDQLLLYESIDLPDVSTYYALLGDTAKPVAVACFQVLRLKPLHIDRAILNTPVQKLLPGVLNTIKPGLLVAGHLFRHDITSFYADGLSNIEAYRAYESMIQTALQVSCSVAALIKDVPEFLVPYFQNFAPHYQLLRNDISMQMDLPAEWQSFADYETSLKHKYAQKLRKVRSQISRLEIKELNAADAGEQAETLYALYRQVSDKQPLRLGYLNAAFLPALKKFYGEQLKLWAFYEGDVMVAFASAWLHQEVFDMFYIGFDYARNSELQLYFNILYFSIEQAIEQHKTKLVLGRTALEAKARLGCRPSYLHTFLYIRNGYLRRLVAAQQQKQYQEEGAWEERHPFKK